jgi:hypothetical protein
MATPRPSRPVLKLQPFGTAITRPSLPRLALPCGGMATSRISDPASCPQPLGIDTVLPSFAQTPVPSGAIATTRPSGQVSVFQTAKTLIVPARTKRKTDSLKPIFIQNLPFYRVSVYSGHPKSLRPKTHVAEQQLNTAGRMKSEVWLLIQEPPARRHAKPAPPRPAGSTKFYMPLFFK